MLTKNMWVNTLKLGVSYSQTFRGKRGFPKFTNSRASQSMLPKYFREYQNVKIVKSKFESEKSSKNKHKINLVLKESMKKDIKMLM